MDRTLPLHPLHSLLPLDQPFTPAMARSVGISSRALSRMLSAGLVRRVLRGVYVASTARPSAALRANSVGLVLRPGDVVVIQDNSSGVFLIQRILRTVQKMD